MSNNCEFCDHPLIDHGDYPEDSCNCCSGRLWLESNIASRIPKDEETPKSSKSAGQIPRGFVPVPDFPEYVISKQGTVKHVATGKFCFLVRISTTGEAMISLRNRGKSYTRSVQELRARAFPELYRGKKNA